MRPTMAFIVAACASLIISCAQQPAANRIEKPRPVVAPVPVPPPSPPAALPRPPWPLTAIGRVNRRPGGFCSGTLIAPDKVLTTAHCLWDTRLGRWISIADLHFLAGYHLGDALAHRKVKAIELAADIKMTGGGMPLRAANDWAIMTLTRPIGPGSAVRPLELARLEGRPRSSELGPLLLAGYGRRRPHAIEQVRCKAVSLINPTVLLHDCGVARSRSGFPILVKMAGGWRVLGLQMMNPNQGVGRKGLGMALLVAALGRRRQMILW